MMQFELNDIILFVKFFKFPSHNFDIMNYFTFPAGTTRSSNTFKLRQQPSKFGISSHFYTLGDSLVCARNSLPIINLDSSFASIVSQLKKLFWSQFQSGFNTSDPCSYHFLFTAKTIMLFQQHMFH